MRGRRCVYVHVCACTGASVCVGILDAHVRIMSVPTLCLNKQLNKQSRRRWRHRAQCNVIGGRDSGDLRRNRAHYDVNVMGINSRGRKGRQCTGWLKSESLKASLDFTASLYNKSEINTMTLLSDTKLLKLPPKTVYLMTQKKVLPWNNMIGDISIQRNFCHTYMK